jgi:hypothetical protein
MNRAECEVERILMQAFRDGSGGGLSGPCRHFSCFSWTTATLRQARMSAGRARSMNDQGAGLTSASKTVLELVGQAEREVRI